jgi:hypothetical protein
MLKKFVAGLAVLSFAVVPAISPAFAATKPSVSVPGGEDEEGEHQSLFAVAGIGAIVIVAAGAIAIRRRK